MIKVKFEFSKMVSYWNKDEGAGVRVDGTRDMSSWHTDGSWLNQTVSVDSIKDVQNELKIILDSEYIPSDYLAIMDDGRISFNVFEDGEANILDGEQVDELHEKGEQVYLCDYNVYIEIQNVYEPTASQLAEMFPSAEYL